MAKKKTENPPEEQPAFVEENGLRIFLNENGNVVSAVPIAPKVFAGAYGGDPVSQG